MLEEPRQWPASETPLLDEQEDVEIHSPLWPLLTVQDCARTEERIAEARNRRGKEGILIDC